MEIQLMAATTDSVEIIIGKIKKTLGNNFLNFKPKDLKINKNKNFLQVNLKMVLLVKLNQKSPQKNEEFDSLIKKFLSKDSKFLDHVESQIQV